MRAVTERKLILLENIRGIDIMDGRRRTKANEVENLFEIEDK